MKKLLLILLISGVTLHLFAADDVVFKAQAPAQVIVGKPFQLTYTINQRAKDLRVPEFTDFDHIAGPFQSQSSSTSFVNGKRTSTFTLSFTYTLIGLKEGTYTIAPATIKVDGNQHTSNGVRITVLPPDQANAASSASQGNTNAASSQVADNETIFVRTLVSKTKVHEQEAIVVSYKLYFSGVEIAQLTNNTRLPEFKGFLKQDFDLGETQAELEHYNGRNYQTALLYRTLLFPQRSGEITIEPARFEAVLRVRNRAQVRSIFDDFFDSYTQTVKPLEAPGMTIKVEQLPSGKLASFSGGVGQFSLNSKISSTSQQANEAVTLTLTIQGAGNMKLLKTPAVDWPEGFEVYDPKVTNNFKNTVDGTSGSKTIEYLAIPRSSGTYTIPAVEFSYYDVKEQQYRTLSTPSYTIDVARSSADSEASTVVSQFVNKEDIQLIGTDIRYIYTNDLAPTKQRLLTIAFGSLSYWLFYIIPLLLSIILFVIFRKRIAENSDITRVRYKKANKVAKRRLKAAEKLLQENKKELFYEEVARAAWLYLSDRLSIPTAQLNKDNVAQMLLNRGVDQVIVDAVREVLSTAEFARYAPVEAGAMQDLYDATAKVINDLENYKL